MARMFITNREIDLINNITNEVIKDICGQTIIYYAINEEYTKTNFYSESDQKVFDTPLEIEVLVEYTGESEVTMTKFGMDSIFEISVFFHNKDLLNKNIVLREGDFIQYVGRFFEITKLTRPKDIFGQNENIVGIHANCRTARKEQFRTMVVLPPKNTFTPARGLAGGNQHHDKRPLEDGATPKVTRITGSITFPIT